MKVRITPVLLNVLSSIILSHKGSKGALPQVNEAQLTKLRLLTIVSLALERRVRPPHVFELLPVLNFWILIFDLILDKLRSI